MKRLFTTALLAVFCLNLFAQEELTAAIGKDLLTPNFEAEYARIQGLLLALL